MRIIFLFFLVSLSCLSANSQAHPEGVLTGNVMDEKSKALSEASVQLIPLLNKTAFLSATSDKDGGFSFHRLPYGYYQLRLSYAGLQPLVIDSIYLRTERSDFNLADLVLKPGQSANLQEVIVFAEKPLIQSRDGNITFNVSESALAAGSNASELLTSVPLVTKDADGKIAVRGKEPRILIDDKPVELNLQQLQDLLESLPGSSIEKIEVMTNPPPQYANEQGGVINIITRKGKVGRTGRVSLSTGTRGDISVNGSFTYRRQGLVLNINGGGGYSLFNGEGYSVRKNSYADSSNSFTTRNNNQNKSVRPNFRVNLDYDISKFQSLNAVVQLNGNDFTNHSTTEYRNINRFGDTYRLSERNIRSEGNNLNGSLNLSYLLKTKRAGEQLRVIGSANLSSSDNERFFYQQYFHPDHTPNGLDSTQEQLTANTSTGYTLRVNYDRPVFSRRTFLSTGGYYIRNNSDIGIDAASLQKSTDEWIPSSLLSNDFRFHQTVANLRVSVKQLITEKFSITAGLATEQTAIWFELLKEQRDARNNYRTLLPFANINRNWSDKLNLTLSYRRSIQRPGINEMNPGIDFSDPYNVRFGNEKLEASTADNFDLVLGSNHRNYYFNIGMGYNHVKDIFSRVRSLLADGKTQVTWENISGRREYEMSTWAGFTVNKKLRTNISASYIYNQYSAFDRSVNRYRNGGSFSSNLSTTYTPRDAWNLVGSFTFNRFANPQGYARWNWSMNAGVQRKLLQKRLTVTFNVIDPFAQQQNRNFTYGPGFNLESYSTTTTRNFRVSMSYTIAKQVKKNPLNKLVKPV